MTKFCRFRAPLYRPIDTEGEAFEKTGKWLCCLESTIMENLICEDSDLEDCID